MNVMPAISLPRIGVATPAVFLSAGGEVCVAVELKDMNPLLTLVIDVYPCMAPSHPQRHLGWFQFADLADGIRHFRFTYTGNSVAVVSESGSLPSATWVNDEFDPLEVLPLSLRVVLRNKLNNQIVFEDAVIVYESPDQCLEQQRYFEQRQQMLPQGVPFQTIVDPAKVVAIVVKELRDHDAVGYFCWETWALLRANGIQARLYVGRCDDKFRPFVRNVHELLDEPDLRHMRLFYQFSIMDAALEWLRLLHCPKVAYFHGITDPANLRVFDGELARACKDGMRQIPLLASFDRVLVNSVFSRDVLMAELPASSPQPAVLPPVATVRSVWNSLEADCTMLARFRYDSPLILYVGRVFPNKRVEELLAVFASYVLLEPSARLVLVGSSHTSYQRYLEYRMSLMKQDIVDRIVFLPGLAKQELKAIYQQASCFITMSGHEGFGVPMLEAMLFGLPVIARHCTAIPEVLQGAGKLFRHFDPDVIAQEVQRLHKDRAYREKVIARQHVSVARFTDEGVALALMEAIVGLETGDEGPL